MQVTHTFDFCACPSENVIKSLCKETKERHAVNGFLLRLHLMWLIFGLKMSRKSVFWGKKNCGSQRVNITHDYILFADSQPMITDSCTSLLKRWKTFSSCFYIKLYYWLTLKKVQENRKSYWNIRLNQLVHVLQQHSSFSQTSTSISIT